MLGNQKKEAVPKETASFNYLYFLKLFCGYQKQVLKFKQSAVDRRQLAVDRN